MINNSSGLLSVGCFLLYFNQPGTDSKEQISDSSYQTCPICSLESIPSDKNQCPQCDADLTCFKVLNTLPDEPVQAISAPAETDQAPAEADQAIPAETDQAISAPAETDQAISAPAEADQAIPAEADQAISAEDIREKNPVFRNIAFPVIFLLMCLTVAMAVFQLYRFNRFESLLNDHKTYFRDSMASMSAKLEELKAANSGLQVAVSELQVPGSEFQNQQPATSNQQSAISNQQPAASSQQPAAGNQQPAASSHQLPAGLWTYDATEKDTLWSISKTHYGSGYLYPVLLEHNPHLDIYGIGEGVKIKILRHAESAKEIYRNIIVRQGNRVYWNYTVAENDTLKSVVQRFYKKDLKKQGIHIDPEVRLDPGQKIRILVR